MPALTNLLVLKKYNHGALLKATKSSSMWNSDVSALVKIALPIVGDRIRTNNDLMNVTSYQVLTVVDVQLEPTSQIPMIQCNITTAISANITAWKAANPTNPEGYPASYDGTILTTAGWTVTIT